MNDKEKRSYLFGELLACLENLDCKEVIMSTDLRNYRVFPKQMHKYLYEKVHDSRIGSGQPNILDTAAGEEITRIYSEMPIAYAESSEPLDGIYLIAKHKMSVKLKKLSEV